MVVIDLRDRFSISVSLDFRILCFSSLHFYIYFLLIVFRRIQPNAQSKEARYFPNVVFFFQKNFQHLISLSSLHTFLSHSQSFIRTPIRTNRKWRVYLRNNLKLHFDWFLKTLILIGWENIKDKEKGGKIEADTHITSHLMMKGGQGEKSTQEETNEWYKRKIKREEKYY